MSLDRAFQVQALSYKSFPGLVLRPNGYSHCTFHCTIWCISFNATMSTYICADQIFPRPRLKWQLSVVLSYVRLWQQRGEETDTEPTIKTPAHVSLLIPLQFRYRNSSFYCACLFVCFLFSCWLLLFFFFGYICFLIFVRFIFLNHNYFSTYPLASQWLTHISFQLKAR